MKFSPARCDSISEICSLIKNLDLKISRVCAETNNNFHDICLAEGKCFVLKFLLELLQQLEIMVTSSISQNLEMVKCNLDLIRMANHYFKFNINK